MYFTLFMKKKRYDATFLLLNLTTKKSYKWSIHGQIPLEDIYKSLQCQSIYDSEYKVKVYTNKELVLFE